VPLTLSNNIISDNVVSGGGHQVGGSAMCSFTYSDIGPDTVSGTGNTMAPPLFVNPSAGDYHLMANSPCVDAADPNADLTGVAAKDIDGETRTKPADIGADEVP
jgi:hypothetical protein